MKRRIMSIFVTVLMVFAMMPMSTAPVYAKFYPLYVGGEQVNDSNCNSIATNSEGAVTASFDPSTLTLTLNNFNASENIFCRENMGDLTINLKGTNYISTYAENGIFYAGNLVIQDDPSDNDVGELIVESINGNHTKGIGLTGSNLTISECKVTTKAHDCQYSCYGIIVERGGKITIDNGTVISTAGNSVESFGIAAFGNDTYPAQPITIKGKSEVIASGYSEAITGEVINEILGKGWTDIDGTEGEEGIYTSETARGLRNHDDDYFKKVHFTNYSLLTITANDQNLEYTGEMQGPGDAAYEDPAEIAEVVTVEGLQGDDALTSIQVDGQGQNPGTYPLKPYGAMVGSEGCLNDNYIIKYVNGTLTIKDKPAPEPQPEPKPEPKPTPVKVSGTPVAKVTAAGKTGLTIGWNKVNGADGYDIFFARCKHDEKKAACKNVKTIEGNDTFKWTKSGLRKGIPYKAYVKAYVMQDGVKKYVKTSPVMHAYTGNGTKRYTNAKSVSVNKTKVTLKQGKKFKIKAKVNKVKKGKTLMSTNHAPKLRYLTSDSSIAKVSKSGKITAKGKGTCYIYVYAHNGVYKKIKVTVK